MKAIYCNTYSSEVIRDRFSSFATVILLLVSNMFCFLFLAVFLNFNVSQIIVKHYVLPISSFLEFQYLFPMLLVSIILKFGVDRIGRRLEEMHLRL